MVTFFAHDLQDMEYRNKHKLELQSQPADRDALQFLLFTNNNNNTTMTTTTTTTTNPHERQQQHEQQQQLQLQQHEQLQIIARNVSMIENVHIDKQKGRLPNAYYGTFVDLYLAIYATLYDIWYWLLCHVCNQNIWYNM